MTTLPEEVLYEIFRLATKRNVLSGPIALSHCCRKWRSVALGASILWTYVLIRQPGHQYMDRLKVWVERSGGNHLDIWIEARSPFDEFNGHLHQCLAVLLPHTDRWGSFTLRAPPSTAEVCQMLSNCFLSELSRLSIPYRRDGTGIVWSGILQAKMPKLRDLNMTGRAFFNSSQTLEWMSSVFHQGLKRVSIRYPKSSPIVFSMSVYLAILSSCPFLEEFDFGVAVRRVYYGNEPGSIEGITMASLQKLRLAWQSSTRIRRLLTPIHAPKLVHLNAPIRTFYLRRMLEKPEFPFPALEYVILESRSRDTLTETRRSPTIVNFLSRLPELRYLVLKSFTFGKPMTESWTFMASLASICPNLQRLEFRNCQGLGFGEELQELIENRRLRGAEGIRDITRVHIHYSTTCLSEKGLTWFIKNVADFGYFYNGGDDRSEEDTEIEDEAKRDEGQDNGTDEWT